MIGACSVDGRMKWKESRERGPSEGPAGSSGGLAPPFREARAAFVDRLQPRVSIPGAG